MVNAFTAKPPREEEIFIKEETCDTKIRKKGAKDLELPAHAS